MVDFSGNLRGFGRSFPVEVQHPRGADAPPATWLLRDAALSTSGDYERSFLLDGVRYSHILDPRTGRPARGVGSVTVAAPSAVEADALSTALFVLGPERGSRLLATRHPGAGALVVTLDEHDRVAGIVCAGRLPEAGR
jgi:thiamine biosynthesis lipoprotein